MAIYFGSTGFIELKRDALNSQIGTSLDPADVNTTKKRFSVENINGSLITGDQVEIETVDGSNLQLLSNHDFPDLRKYIHIDDMVRAYIDIIEANTSLNIIGLQILNQNLETTVEAGDYINLSFQIKNYGGTSSRRKLY